jgi:hypothetical protein
LARAHYLRGWQCASQKDYAETIKSWREYLNECPNDQKVSGDLAELYFLCARENFGGSKESWRRAEGLLAKAISLRTQNSRKYKYYRAICRLKQGESLKAASELAELTDGGVLRDRARYHLGLSLLLADKRQEGLQILEEMKAKQAEDGYPRYSAWALANERIREGRIREAGDLLAAAHFG